MVCVKEREMMVCLKQTAMRDANERRRELSPDAVCYIHFLFFTELSGKSGMATGGWGLQQPCDAP